MTEVNGTPVWTAHPETGVAEAIAALLVEFYKKVDKRKRNLPDGQRANADDTASSPDEPAVPLLVRSAAEVGALGAQ